MMISNTLHLRKIKPLLSLMQCIGITLCAISYGNGLVWAQTYNKATDMAPVSASMRKEWSSAPAIGLHPQLDQQGAVIEPLNLQPNGRMTSPIDQRVPIPLPSMSVAPGSQIPCEIEPPQDWDTYSFHAQEGVEEQLNITSVWTATHGKFLITDENGAHSLVDSVTGLSGVWIAPSDVTESVEAYVRCTVRDISASEVPRDQRSQQIARTDGDLIREAKMIISPYHVQFSGQLVNGSSYLRACAGGVDDHNATDPAGGSDFQYRAHTRSVTARITHNDQPASNTSLRLAFAKNKGYDYGTNQEILSARVHNYNEPINSAHPWVETLDISTDANGETKFWVKSSDVAGIYILQVLKLLPSGEAPSIGELSCDFAQPTLKRNFSDLSGRDSGDDGWLFYSKVQSGPITDSYLVAPDDTMAAKVYLKFLVDNTVPDQMGNWQFVNGHKLLFEIESIRTASEADFTSVPEDLQYSDEDEPLPPESDLNEELPDDFVDPGDEEGPEVPDTDEGITIVEPGIVSEHLLLEGNVASVSKTSSSDGAAQVLLVGKALARRMKKVVMIVTNQTAWLDE